MTASIEFYENDSGELGLLVKVEDQNEREIEGVVYLSREMWQAFEEKAPWAMGSPLVRKVYTSNNFKGHYPVGTAAVILARDEAEALEVLADAIRDEGLSEDPNATVDLWYDLATGCTPPDCKILHDGSY